MKGCLESLVKMRNMTIRSLFADRIALSVFAVITLAGISAVAFVINARANGGSEASIAAGSIEPAAIDAPLSLLPAAPLRAERSDDIKVRLVTITPRGFEPEEIVTSENRFILAIDDQSRLHELDLQLHRAAGGKLREVKMKPHKKYWNGLLELTPGEYVLIEPNHPNSVCKITISPGNQAQ